MLIVIVVSAATLLAAFVATYQKQVQNQEAYAHDQSLESIHILSLNTTLNSTETGFATFGFTLASASVNPSGILGISVNNNVLECFNWTDLDNKSKGQYSLAAGGDYNLTIAPLEEMYISTDLNPKDSPSTGCAFSYFGSSNIPLPNSYIKFDVYTVLQNDFNRVFLPPVPLAVASEINPSGSNPITLLDGSGSFQPGGNASIVNWAWDVSGSLISTNTTLPANFTDAGTPRIHNGALTPGTIIGTNATANFTVPVDFTFGSGDTLEFTLYDSLNVSPPSDCSLADSVISPGAKGKFSGSTLIVTFNLSTVLSGTSCTGATLSLAPSGVTLSGVLVNAVGEEYQVTPALPYYGSTQAPYIVILSVTNSVGLIGTLTETYVPPA